MLSGFYRRFEILPHHNHNYLLIRKIRQEERCPCGFDLSQIVDLQNELGVLFIVFAMFGAYLVGVSYLGLDGGQFLTSLENAVDFENDIAVSLLKSVVFGGLVAIIATYRGYTSEPTAAGVSAATTGTVVVASLCVLIFDYMITALWGV